jgi:MoaA/NifB/PqqE/SkfB family radical SAM enzyme
VSDVAARVARQPTVEWQVAGACNYDCSYCIQSPVHRRGRPDSAHVDQALVTFASLPGSWELKCSGGEAFAHPLFLARIVPGILSRTPHTLSVLTNFSAPREDLARFLELGGERLRIVSASLHLEFTAVDEFVAKARWFVDRAPPTMSFVVNQVVLPGRLAEAAACKVAVEGAGLRWFPQLYKVDGGVAAYPDEAALRALIGAAPGPREANVAPSWRGRRCHAGVDYFTVDKDGTAWSCRTAKRHREGRLGNLYDGTLRRWVEARACPYSICPCTVPANRGMIEGVS